VEHKSNRVNIEEDGGQTSIHPHSLLHHAQWCRHSSTISLQERDVGVMRERVEMKKLFFYFLTVIQKDKIWLQTSL
jgi:hypothetical protein